MARSAISNRHYHVHPHPLLVIMNRAKITAASALILSGVPLLLPSCEDTQSPSAQSPSADLSAKSGRIPVGSSPGSRPETSRDIEEILIGYWAPELEATTRAIERASA